MGQPITTYEFGSLVEVLESGAAGVVVRPVSTDQPGQVLAHAVDELLAVEVMPEDIREARPETGGWAQFARTLIELGSHIIEKRLTDLVDQPR